MDIVIAGAGGSGLKVLQILEDLKAAGSDDFSLIGFIDDDPSIHGTTYFDYEVLGDHEALKDRGTIAVACPIGDPINRQRMIERLSGYDVQFPNLVHPTAQISKRSQLGQGNLFSQNCVVQAGVQIGSFNTFNMASTLGPLAQVTDYCTVNSQVMIASGAELGRYCYIGMGAKVVQRLAIPEGVTVGANAFVNKSPQAWSIAVGVPAKVIKEKERPS